MRKRRDRKAAGRVRALQASASNAATNSASGKSDVVLDAVRRVYEAASTATPVRAVPRK
jgi:hypothetical protein